MCCCLQLWTHATRINNLKNTCMYQGTSKRLVKEEMLAELRNTFENT